MSLSNHHLDQEAEDFYRSALERLREADVPFLVGGAFAFERYTGIKRHTKDVDLFIIRRDLNHAFEALSEAGSEPEMTSSHWLAKVKRGELFLDLIFATGNGVATVDDGWFERATEAKVLGVPVKLCSAEDIIWNKAFIQERERFDGADVAHLILKAGLDWDVLLGLFGRHWRVLYAHLVLFEYIYPSERHRIPRAVMEELTDRVIDELDVRPASHKVVRGTVVSRAQYLVDVQEWGFRDGRLEPDIGMSREDVEAWTRAIDIDGPG
jgi:predicted nucleotidyltransferase